MRRLNENYEFVSFDTSHWFNLFSILPQFTGDRGILFLLYQGSEILQAYHSLQGSRPDLTGPFSSPPVVIQQMQQREDVDAVFMVEQGLVVYLIAKMQAAFTPEIDIIQYLELAQTSLEEEFERRFHVWPKEFWNKGLFNLFKRTRALLDELPSDYICILAVFEENTIWASLIIQGVDGQVRRITTTKALEPLGITISDWQTDYSKLLEVVAQKMGTPTLGVFTDDETLRFLMRSEAPLKFIQQARRTKQIIVEPIPSRIRNRLG
ncbi:MAG: hypothetical protein ACXACH_06250 [Candidatus Hermodarchaeia archaeon]|jgi:hypothetical protein